jgi:hypothetical protein
MDIKNQEAFYWKDINQGDILWDMAVIIQEPVFLLLHQSS